MKELLKSGLKTFLPTLGVVAVGWICGMLIAQLFIWIIDKQGPVISTIVFISLVFLFIWGANAYRDYKLKLLQKKWDEELEEMTKNLRQPKTK